MTPGPACHGIWQAPRPFAFPPCFSFFSQRGSPADFRSSGRFNARFRHRSGIALPDFIRHLSAARFTVKITCSSRVKGSSTVYVKETSNGLRQTSKNTKFNRYTHRYDRRLYLFYFLFSCFSFFLFFLFFFYSG